MPLERLLAITIFKRPETIHSELTTMLGLIIAVSLLCLLSTSAIEANNG